MYSLFKSNEDVLEKEKFILLMENDFDINKFESLGIILPSDPDWRTENYFRLVELHRAKTGNDRCKIEKIIPRRIFQRGYPALGLWALRSSEKKELKLPFLTVDSEPVINWIDDELIAAGKILEKLDITPTYFEKNQDKMRRIVGLVYDVLRYKNVLKEVLADIEYFTNYPMDIHLEKKLWLLLYDMICRGFRNRKDKMTEDNEKEFSEEALDGLHSRLWKNKTQIAAHVARIRIQKQARYLADLLPKRIRMPSNVVRSPIVEGWMNVYRIPYNEIPDRFKELGLSRHIGREVLPPLTFSEDHLLPYHYYCHPFARSSFLNSELINNRDFVVQSRTHCISAAIIVEVMKNNELVGSVVQTDVVALPASGYMAALLWINKPLLSHLIIFGAGDRQQYYEVYFKNLGVQNIYVFPEDFSDIDPKDPRLQGVVLVMACPPCSNSSILDPVDLSISRGGDIKLLKDLTNRAEDICNEDDAILNKQRTTLQRALSIPQVQGVIYETFSEFESENIELAKSVIKEMNEWAAQKHYRESYTEPTEEADTEPTEETLLKEVEVPICDLYDLSPLPDICPQERNCLSLENEGVFIALIMRKKITRLDSKFMISMAEERGLFGTGNKNNNEEVEKLLSEDRPSSSIGRRKPRTEINMKRISAPTFCSNLKDIQKSKMTFCERSQIRKLSPPRMWWKALQRYLQYSKKYSEPKRKLHFPRRNLSFLKRKNVYHLKKPKIILKSNKNQR
ncbi:putative methyltransferase NSUN7 [Halyomorpha halys]|uniref:putative methyltransferase NSUN7 n=1 Tax=Halyomorpha halys TaxID=286706 RepID=UPI0006D50544